METTLFVEFEPPVVEHLDSLEYVVLAAGGRVVQRDACSLTAAFPAATGAAAAGLRLGALRGRMRAGVDTDGDGAARLSATAHTGQVLVSASVGSGLDADLRDLGEHRLRDLAPAERLF